MYDISDDDGLDVTEDEIDQFLKKYTAEIEQKQKMASKIEKQRSSMQVANLKSNLPQEQTTISPERTIALIEDNEQRKLKSQIQASQMSNFTTPRNYSMINEMLNLIKKRILFHLDLAKSLKKSTKSVFIHTFTYVLIYHTKNLANMALQIMSGEQSWSAFDSNPGLWQEYMASHDHSIQTDNFVRLSEKVYKLLYHSYDRLGHLKDAANSNPSLTEAAKLIWDPDDEDLNDVTESLDLLMLGLTGSLDRRVSSASSGASKRNQSDPKTLRKIQLKISICRMMNLLGIFSDKATYQEFDLDGLVETVDSLEDEMDVLNRTIHLNEYLLSVDKSVPS